MEIHAFPINVFWTPHVRKTLSKHRTSKTHQWGRNKRHRFEYQAFAVFKKSFIKKTDLGRKTFKRQLIYPKDVFCKSMRIKLMFCGRLMSGRRHQIIGRLKHINGAEIDDIDLNIRLLLFLRSLL